MSAYLLSLPMDIFVRMPTMGMTMMPTLSSCRICQKLKLRSGVSMVTLGIVKLGKLEIAFELSE